MKLTIERPTVKKEIDLLMEEIFKFAFTGDITEYNSTGSEITLSFKNEETKKQFKILTENNKR